MYLPGSRNGGRIFKKVMNTKTVKIVSKPRYFVGIDPGVKTGLAVWDSKEQAFLSVETKMLHEAFLSIIEMKNNCNCEFMVIVEDARLRKFDKGLTKEKLQGAGSVKRDCKAWEDFLKDYSIPFKMVAPRANLNKLAEYSNLKTWTLNTKWTKQTSEHARCAAMLVFKS